VVDDRLAPGRRIAHRVSESLEGLKRGVGALMGETPSTNAAILLVEDNPDHALLAKLAISRLDEVREVRVAGDGIQALEQLRTAAQLPDLVLLDLKLPRLDGFGFLEALREDPRFKKLPVVVLTTSAARKDLERSRELGAVGYLTKPLDGGALRRFMQRLADTGEGWSGQQELPL
jgi:CheY-like chemotaxis protein